MTDVSFSVIDIQRENTELGVLDRLAAPKRCFVLDSCHSPFLAVSEDAHMLIEDDNHLVLFDEQRRINEIPWQKQQDSAFVGAIKDLTYSNYLEQFCILSSVNFFTIDPHTIALEKIEQIKPSTGNKLKHRTSACRPHFER